MEPTQGVLGEAMNTWFANKLWRSWIAMMLIASLYFGFTMVGRAVATTARVRSLVGTGDYLSDDSKVFRLYALLPSFGFVAQKEIVRFKIIDPEDVSDVMRELKRRGFASYPMLRIRLQPVYIYGTPVTRTCPYHSVGQRFDSALQFQ